MGGYWGFINQNKRLGGLCVVVCSVDLRCAVLCVVCCVVCVLCVVCVG